MSSLLAEEILPDFQYPYKLILDNVEEFAVYLQNIKETEDLKSRRFEAHIYLTDVDDREVVAILRIHLKDEHMKDVAQDTRRELMAAKGDVRETALALMPGVYHISYPDVFMIVL